MSDFRGDSARFALGFNSINVSNPEGVGAVTTPQAKDEQSIN